MPQSLGDYSSHARVRDCANLSCCCQASWLDSLSCLVVSWSCKLALHRCTASLHNSTLWRRVRWLSSLGVSGGVSVVGDGMMVPFLMASIDKTGDIFVVSYSKYIAIFHAPLCVPVFALPRLLKRQWDLTGCSRSSLPPLLPEWKANGP